MTKLGDRKGSMLDSPYLIMGIVLLLWGTFAAVSKLALKSIDSLQLQFYLFLIAFIEMTALCIYNGKIKELFRLSKRDILRLSVYAIPSFLYYVFYLMALKMIPAVEASMLNYLYPITIVIFAIPINGEKLDINKVVSIIVGFVGVIIILTNGSFSNIRMSNITGDLLAIGAAVLWGIFSNLGKRNKVDTILSNYIYVIVTLVLSAVIMFMFSGFTLPDMKTLTGLAWLSTSNILLSYYLWFRALKAAPSSLIASISFATPFVSLIFIMLLVGESITLMQIAGLLVILIGTAVQSVDFNFRLKHEG